MSFLILVLAAVAVHRIWNYETVFDTARSFFIRVLPPWPSYALTCRACNALWIGVGVAFVGQIDHWAVATALTGLACYPILRGLVWAWASLPETLTWGQRPQQALVSNVAGTASPKAEPACATCEKKKESLQEEQARVLSYEKRVVLMTTLANFNASYSVSTCVLDQARALATVRPKWLIQIWVMQVFDESLWPKDIPPNVELRKIIPTVRFAADGYDSKTAGLLSATVQRELVALGNADIITHDLLFQSSYLNFAAAIHAIGGTKGFRWWHQAHSGPAPLPERPQLPLLYRYSLPGTGQHTVLNLNTAHVDAFAKHYGTDRERVVACPNVRDPRLLHKASPAISKFIGATKLLEADIVQVLPVSTERSFAKGVQHAIRIFGSLKAKGKSVRLVVVNAHANGNERIIGQLQEIGNQWGLKDELIFTSQHFPRQQLSVGLSADDTQMLFRLSNLFIFPSIAEASSLVLAEAAAAGCLLVTNASVPALSFDAPEALNYPFGTSGGAEWPEQCPSPDAIAEIVIQHLSASVADRTQRYVFRNRSLEAVGHRLAEALA